MLLSLGQFVERPDLANGPRTVVDVFCRAIGRVVPLDGLIEHHDEKPIDRLREKQLAQAVG